VAPTDEPLADLEDAFGRLLLDYLAGRAGEPLLERDDGTSGPALPAESFFAEYAQWPAEEREAFGFVRGRVLDIGAGAGRHSLEAERQGLEVVAIDISPGAVEVCRRRGVSDARLLPLAAVDEHLGVFDTVLMMCGNVGLVGSEQQAQEILRRLEGMTTTEGRIVLDSVDPHVDNDAADIAYLEGNRAKGRMAGQVTIRIRYLDRVTPWFNLLCLSVAELERLIVGTGWRLERVIEGEPPEYYAVLAKTTSN
jgi:SAM-dependent methyltransferase